ncbi:B12-binding domain-containing protein [uncultured Algimonas sp.]|uniref:cobalamin B12-binding domain-containing protein n=1 Tax=uncultured Algimonas sp. TaxID=1547920 RepID=UPI00261CFAF7|nr:B12-binding domain-containing protein [uncultured Algimonas sp.]
MSDEPELILADLSDDELVEQMKDDLYDGMGPEIAEGTQILLDRGWDANAILTESLVEAMRIVGLDFGDGILFVPEVLSAANAMKGGMELLRPILAANDAVKPTGRVVIGTVKGDIHDIGKNLVAMMLEGAGFEVMDLGINTDVEEFLKAYDEFNPDLLGMSALLTTTMPYMGVVIEEFEKRGLRKDCGIFVGGAPVNQEFADAIGATEYGGDASNTVELAKRFMGVNRP